MPLMHFDWFWVLHSSPATVWQLHNYFTQWLGFGIALQIFCFSWAPSSPHQHWKDMNPVICPWHVPQLNWNCRYTLSGKLPIQLLLVPMPCKDHCKVIHKTLSHLWKSKQYGPICTQSSSGGCLPGHFYQIQQNWPRWSGMHFLRWHTCFWEVKQSTSLHHQY